MSDAGAPIRIDVRRGGIVESVHHVDAVVVDSAGSVVASWGDPDRPVIPRSAIKAVQALPLIASGAADAFDVTDDELALACSSHSAEPEHVAAVRRWLDRVGADESKLECGPDHPIDTAAAEGLVRSETPTAPIYNCCSGKHSGFITTARHHGETIGGYLSPSSAVQQRVTAAIEAMTGVDVSSQTPGIDGCGIPVYSLPMNSLARSMARLVDHDAAPDHLRAGAQKLTEVLPSRAWWVAGTGRAEVVVTAAAQEPLIVKAGAEAVFMGALPERGVGFALKARDGAYRGSEFALDALLRSLGVLGELSLDASITNKAGDRSGEIVANLS